MGELLMINIILVVATIVLQALLYVKKEDSKFSGIIFILNSIFSLIVLFMAFTALPSNYTLGKVVVGLVGAIGIGGMVIRIVRKDLIIVSKIMLSVSIIVNLAQLFL